MSNAPPSIIFFRSFCCGIAGIVAAFFVWMWGYMVLAGISVARSHPGGSGTEVGWDLVTIIHNSHRTAEVVALAGFLIGFALGYRSFFRNRGPQRP